MNLIRSEEPDEVVLVAHSYARMVITGTADTLERECPGLIRHLIYVDAVVPKPGERWSSRHPAEIIKGRIEAARQSGGAAIPPPDAQLFGLQGADREWVSRRQTPQSVGVCQDPLSFDIRRIAQFPRT